MTTQLATLLRAHGARRLLQWPGGAISGEQVRECSLAARGRCHDVAPGALIAVRATSSAETVLELFELWESSMVALLLDPRDPTPVPSLPAALPGIATVIRTSGSSGAPRLAAHRFCQLVAGAQASLAAVDLAAGDDWLLSLPLHHVSGLAIVLRALCAGATVTIPPTTCDVTTAVAASRPTHVSLVATQLRRCLRDRDATAALANCKAVLCGGGPVPQSLRDAARRAGVPVVVGYGSTETSAMIAAERPLPGVDLRVGDSGEISVASPSLFAGYVTTGGLTDPRSADGYFATGDTGTLDRSGRLTVTGRVDAMFISGGENIQPEEIERALLEFDGVDDAVVVPEPSAEYGQRPVALIALAPNAAVRATQVAEFLERRLPRFKIPDRFLLLPARAGRLKASRRELIERVRAEPDLQQLR